MLPFVSIIIPCRNEEKFIGKCLDSILAQDYPKDRLEVLVVDGMSEDGTREIVERYTDMSLRARSLACHCEQSEAISARDKLRNLGIATSLPALAMTLKLLDNPKKVTPCALNIGIKNAKGEIILWMSAHSRYEKDYISKCVKYLKEYDADNVGGVMITLPGIMPLSAKLSLPFYPILLAWVILSLEQVQKSQNGLTPYLVAVIKERFLKKSGFSTKN